MNTRLIVRQLEIVIDALGHCLRVYNGHAPPCASAFC